MKLFAYNFPFLFFTLLAAPSAYAADLTVTCSSGGPCAMSPSGAPLFSYSNMVPGDSVTKTIEVINNNSDTCSIELGMSDITQSNSFMDALFSVLYDSIGDIHGVQSGGQATSAKTLTDVADESPLPLGVVDTGESKTYTWLVTFDQAAGNTLQGAQTTFSFDLSFTCDEQSEGPGENPGGSTGTTSASDDGSGDDSGGDGGGDDGSVAGSSASSGSGSTSPGGGSVLGVSSFAENITKQPVVSAVLGVSSLASTGTFTDRAIRILFILGVLMSMVGIYGWTSTKKQRA